MSDFAAFEQAVTSGREATRLHEQRTLAFLEVSTQALIQQFVAHEGRAEYRSDQTNRQASHQDGYYSGEVACSLPLTVGEGGQVHQVVVAARSRPDGQYDIRVDEVEGVVGSPDDFTALIFHRLIRQVETTTAKLVGQTVGALRP